jgi:hypothetical protein
MNLIETNQLISIREYIYQTVNNPALTRVELNDLQEILATLDKKIVEALRSSEFKDFIGFKSTKNSMAKETAANNIKSSIK